MSIKTKYGNASISNGYYKIRSNEHGFRDCYLHNLIMADAIGCGIPKNFIVHHIDGDKKNNGLDNLEILSRSEHSFLHNKGKSQSLESKIKRSKTLSCTSNYFRVCKRKSKRAKQGFIWKYRYYENGKRKAIASVSLKKLEEKVKAKGLEWREL